MASIAPSRRRDPGHAMDPSHRAQHPARATTFTGIADGVPGIPRSLLISRLRELERTGVITRHRHPTTRGATYAMTEAGEDLRNVMLALGSWGERWMELAPEHLDPGVVGALVPCSGSSAGGARSGALRLPRSDVEVEPALDRLPWEAHGGMPRDPDVQPSQRLGAHGRCPTDDPGPDLIEVLGE